MRSLRVFVYYLWGDARTSLLSLARAFHIFVLILLLLAAICLPVFVALEVARGASHIWRGPSCATSTDCVLQLDRPMCVCPQAWRDFVC